MLDDNPFYADCPHCDRFEFKDEDDYFEHVCWCQHDQEQKELEDLGEEE
ncbi:hypothetical protein [Pseudomonas aeruginosa]|nr:hypothetical protein [Pseudomonas aeruginosa]MCV0170170.1 hypothetical protein [Pseudomonas aeruginosa]MDQ9110841.1 hypothetical protein [Pseudomonas aeruginosa]HBO6064774.1 hypothetical protein [Pseudomonas aeruginosa]